VWGKKWPIFYITWIKRELIQKERRKDKNYNGNHM